MIKVLRKAVNRRFNIVMQRSGIQKVNKKMQNVLQHKFVKVNVTRMCLTNINVITKNNKH